MTQLVCSYCKQLERINEVPHPRNVPKSENDHSHGNNLNHRIASGNVFEKILREREPHDVEHHDLERIKRSTSQSLGSDEFAWGNALERRT